LGVGLGGGEKVEGTGTWQKLQRRRWKTWGDAVIPWTVQKYGLQRKKAEKVEKKKGG